MKFKELELFGFKSFADKTRLKFGGGITIVVGPNGSGKSNIFDAVKWVLGTQSPKSLRGSRMEDVIFVGSDDRKTLGMAEVSITLDNSEKTINMDYTEVKVTRRLYRSGESEYFINENPVRLKDIVELFMDTGVGIDSYSVISQGEVDRIINTKPEQRREIFEEAAGITKYIKKRDEALRRLEATEQNMLRINDILVEVKRQAASLERQAKKAEKYKVLKEEWSDIAVRLLFRDIKKKNSKYRNVEGEKKSVDEKIEEENTKLSTHEMKHEEMKILSLQKEKDINEKRERFLIKQQEIKRLEDNLKFLSQRYAELSQRVEELKNENVDNAGKIERIRIEISEKNEVLDVKQREIDGKNTEIEGLTLKVSEFEQGLEARRSEKDVKLRAVEELNKEINTLNNNLVEQEIALKTLDEKLQKNEADAKYAGEKEIFIENELKQITENRGVKKDEIEDIKGRETRLIKEKILKNETKKRTDSMLKDLEMDIGRMESRYGFLKQMHEKLEGYGEIVRKVLTDFKKENTESGGERIIDAVGNLISVEKTYEKAVEKTLSDVLQTVIINDKGVVKDIFTRYADAKGRISLFDSSFSGEAVLESGRKKAAHRNITGYLPDMITVEEKYTPLKALFYNIFTCENLEKAFEIIRDGNSDEEYYILTQQGEFISNRGYYSRAGAGAGAGEGFLSREREISEIKNEIMAAREKQGAVEEEFVRQERKIFEIESEIERLSTLFHSRYVEVVKDDERIKQKEEERIFVKETVKNLDVQKKELIKEKEEKSERIAGIQELSGKKKDEKQRVLELAENAEEGIDRAEEELQGLNRNLEEKRMEFLTAKNEYEMELNNKKTLENRLGEIEAFYENTGKEIESLKIKISESRQERQESENRINEDKNTLSGDEDAWNQSRIEFEGFKKEMDGLEKYIKEMGRERDRLKEQQYELKVVMNELSVDIRALEEKLEEEFKVKAREEQIESEGMDEEQYRELKMNAEEKKEKMDKLGVINLVAIEEYNELKERNEFLQSQYDDLASARSNLQKVIRKTNEESKALFEKAFDEIRGKFSEVFRKMMNGGEADLILIDRENILESGIDIIARPPGKKLQNITLLSGGEKAITAISLLFSLFLTKASPFCVMDEIDAALDDINVVRFTNLVKSFNDITQFIIISHNKITMETADVLYGVSMEKAGVSKIISVKLDGKEKKPADKKEMDEKKVKKERLEGFSTSGERQTDAAAEGSAENTGAAGPEKTEENNTDAEKRSNKSDASGAGEAAEPVKGGDNDQN